MLCDLGARIARMARRPRPSRRSPPRPRTQRPAAELGDRFLTHARRRSIEMRAAAGPSAQDPIHMTVNGAAGRGARWSRAPTLPTSCANNCRLTGTHIGCEHGVCGACTFFVDDKPMRSCLVFGIQCDGKSIATIEGLNDEIMRRLREAFSREHALQCGYLYARDADDCARHRAPATRRR